MAKFEKQFKAAHRVSTPLVTVRTFDAKSTIDHVMTFVETGKDGKPSNIGVIIWDCITGMNGRNKSGKDKLTSILNQAGSNQESTANLPECLRVASFTGEDCILFLSNAHLFWGDPIAIQGVWNLRDKYKAWGAMLILLTSNGAILPAELANDFLVLDEPLPTRDELVTIVNDTFQFAGLKSPKEEIVTSAVTALIGLPSFTAEQSAAMCLNIPAASLDVKGLWERKKQAINQTRGLAVLDTDANLDNIGGLHQFKQYLERIMTGNNPPNVILLWDEIEKAFAGMGSDSSGVKTALGGNVLSWSQDTGMRGIIALGVPGAGKTEVVKGIGNKYGKPVIGFNLADMEHGIVGSSNEYLRNAQALIDAISDKNVLSIATCNNMGALPPEIQRRFATHGIFFFDAPDADTHYAERKERNAIWAIYQKKFSLSEAYKIPPDNGWTGAEIKNCAAKSSELNISLEESAQYIIPVTVSNASTIDTLRRSASDRYLSASTPGRFVYNAPEGITEPMATGRKMR